MKYFNLRPYLIITLFIITLTACQPPLVEEAADILITQPEFTPEPTMPPTNNYTGIAEIDEAIAIILSNSVADKRTLIEYTTVGCTHMDGLGGPPKCDEGVPEGSAITYFPILGPGEGQPVMPGNIDDLLDFTVSELVAVYRPSPETYRSPDYPLGEYSLIFAPVGDGLPVTAQLRNGRIVRLDFSYYPVEYMLQELHGEVLYNRYPQLALVPTETAVPEKTSTQVVKANCLPRTDWPVYTIVAGDNLYNLARDLKTTVATLTKANCLTQPENVLLGQTIYVPSLPMTATPPVTPTATPFPAGTEPKIFDFAIDVPFFRPGVGEAIKLIWQTSGLETEICFNYARAAYHECQQVPLSGVLTHTLKSDPFVTDHWVDISVEVRNGTNVVKQSERVLVQCQDNWFAEGISDWCPTIGVQGSIAQAQWFEEGLIIHTEQNSMVIFEEPGTPCLAYGYLPDLTMDTSFLLPPDGRFLPDPALGKLYLGQFRMSETIRPRLAWATSALLEFAWSYQCEETPDGQGQCFASSPDGRVYMFTAVAGVPDAEGIAVGEGVCPFVN